MYNGDSLASESWDREVKSNEGWQETKGILLPGYSRCHANCHHYNETGWVELEAESNVVAGIGELSATIQSSGIYAIIAAVVPQPTPADFKLANLNINRSLLKIWEPLTFIIRVGEEATITVLVNNYGGQEGTYVATLLQNGIAIAIKEVTLYPSQSQMITFYISGNEPGNYVVKIGGLSGEFTSLIWINWWLIAGLSAALLLLIWAMWYYGYYRRRKRST